MGGSRVRRPWGVLVENQCWWGVMRYPAGIYLRWTGRLYRWRQVHKSVDNIQRKQHDKWSQISIGRELGTFQDRKHGGHSCHHERKKGQVQEHWIRKYFGHQLEKCWVETCLVSECVRGDAGSIHNLAEKLQSGSNDIHKSQVTS